MTETPSLIDNGINNLGTDYVLKTISTTGVEDAYGTATHTFIESTIKAMIGDPLKGDKMVLAGDIGYGDMTATLKSTQEIKVDDRLIYRGDEWEVVTVSIITYQGSVTHKRVGLKRRD